MHSFQLLLGIVLLTLGGEALIRGAMAVARLYAISPLLCGLLIVGFGTSAPELVVSVDAALHRQPDIALGNVVGSNIGNVLLILGVCALIQPLRITPLMLRRDGAAVLAASLLFVGLLGGERLGRSDGVLLLTTLAGYLLWAYWSERKLGAPEAAVHEAEAEALALLPGNLWTAVGSVVLGLILLVSGSQLVLKGAVGLAVGLGISQALVGLTLVAVGTSLPELWTSVMAALRGNADVAVGNILGSNIFNLLGILGISALLQPLVAHSRIVLFDQWVMLATAALLLLLLWIGRKLGRLDALLLLLGYAAYLGVSILLFAS